MHADRDEEHQPRNTSSFRPSSLGTKNAKQSLQCYRTIDARLPRFPFLRKLVRMLYLLSVIENETKDCEKSMMISNKNV